MAIPAPLNPSEPIVPTGRNVLVVEDEPRLRSMLSSAISKMGFDVTTVSTSEEAVRTMRLRAFDIAVLDLNLPGESGLELLERLRRGGLSERERSIQAIVLTGFGDLPAARKAIHLDVVEFLTKPCPLGDLEAALGKAYARRRGQPLDTPIGEPTFSLEDAPEPSPTPTSVTSAVPGQAAVPEGQVPALDDVERDHILATLARNGGNRALAAAELGISLRKLYYRLNDYQRRGRQ